MYLRLHSHPHLIPTPDTLQMKGSAWKNYVRRCYLEK
ncbi:hypothetical protein CsSME_00006061 [Camellia sinensis var. sinensis]